LGIYQGIHLQDAFPFSHSIDGDVGNRREEIGIFGKDDIGEKLYAFPLQPGAVI
jgi:hypothetical protein